MAAGRRCMRETTEVVISVDEFGNVIIDPYYAIFPLDAPLVFRSPDDAPWAIGFLGGRTPTDTRVIHGIGRQMDGDHTTRKRGHFQYSVAVLGTEDKMLDGRPTIFLDPSCPEIIIESFD